MKKFLLLFVSAGLLFFANCNSKAGGEKDNPNEISSDDDTDSDMKKAAANYCDCINETFANLNPAVKNLMIKTSHADDPVISLSNELKEKDGDEYETLLSELKDMSSNTDAKSCFTKMTNKAKIEGDDLETLRKLAKISDGGDDCEFTAAMLRHSVNSKERKKKRKQAPDED